MKTTLYDISGGSRSFVYEITEENDRGKKSDDLLRGFAESLIETKKELGRTVWADKRRKKDMKTEWSGRLAWVGDDGLVEFVTRAVYKQRVVREIRKEAKP